MRVLDWPSRALLAVTAAVVAFAVTGVATGGLHATEVALAEPTPTANAETMPAAMPAATPDPLAVVPAVAAAPTPTPTPTPTPPPPVTIAFGGDVHGEPPIENVLVDGGNPLAGMAEVLQAADLAVVNLETAVGTTGTPADKTYTFQADPSLADALAEAGVDIVSLANNHALDYGYDAAEETMAIVSAAGLSPIGYGEDAAYAPHVVDVEGRTIAFLGISRVLPTISWEASGDRAGMASAYDPDRAVRAVSEATAQADHVVVVMHWGQERHVCPNGNQVQLANLFADAGADLVVGAHPHVLQGIERVGETLVAYSLGNFVFYASRASQRQTGVLTVTLDDGGATSHTWSPAYIDGHGSPQPVATQEQIPAETGTVRTGGQACGPSTSSQ